MAAPLNPPFTHYLVNYTVIPTQASNEVYVPETETSDSLAFLIKNNVMIDFSPVTKVPKVITAPEENL